MRLLALALVLGLTACTPTDTPEVRTIKALTAACEGWASSLNVASSLRVQGRLSPQEIAEVDVLRAVVNPICIDGYYPKGVHGALDEVEAAVGLLYEIKEGK